MSDDLEALRRVAHRYYILWRGNDVWKDDRNLSDRNLDEYVDKVIERDIESERKRITRSDRPDRRD